MKRRGGIIRGRWIVAACISLVSFAPALVSQGIACSSAPFKAITIEYDPVIDSTTASTEPHRFGAHYQIVVQARHAGRSNGGAVTPGLWFQTTDFLAGSSDFAVLIDDSVRFAWQASKGHHTLSHLLNSSVSSPVGRL